MRPPRNKNSEFVSAPPAQFLTAAVKPEQFPQPDRPEVAFAGRSNVGKSSLLNSLLNRRKLARTGKTPGRTQTINFFQVGRSMYFVDLPGFGYAKVPLAVKKAWRPMIESYLTGGRDLRLVILLVDPRRETGEEESMLLSWLAHYDLASLVVATKADKIKRSKRTARASAIQGILGLDYKPLFFSSLTGEGRAEVWAHLMTASGLTAII